MDPGAEGSTAHTYVLGRDSIILSEARPYGRAYIAGVDVENDGGWTGEILVFRIGGGYKLQSMCVGEECVYHA